MWRSVFRFDRYGHRILNCNDSDKNSPKAPYTSLTPPPSYDWIYRGSSALSSSGGEMPPSVPHGGSAGGQLLDSVPHHEGVRTKLKCVLVGDGAVGKTSLVVSYTTNGYPTEYVPTAFDNYNVVVTVDNRPIRLQLCDTAGQDDFDTLRPLCYPGSDVFIVCFSVVSPTSFHNVRDKWLPELKLHNPSAPVLLVGTQSDLRTDVKVLIELAQYREQPVSEIAARKLAQQVGAIGYVESSALTQKNLKEVFDQAIVAALEERAMPAFSRYSSKRGSSRRRKGGPALPADAFVCRSQEQQQEGVIDYAEEERRKGGWRKICCFS